MDHGYGASSIPLRPGRHLTPSAAFVTLNSGMEDELRSDELVWILTDDER